MMKLQVVFNNEVDDSKFAVGWGLSCLVGEDFLFDTGESPDYLEQNMKILGIDPAQLKTVMISHDHWDHTRGLWYILEQNPNIELVICTGFSEEFKKQVKPYGIKIREVEKFSQIEENYWSTGPIASNYSGDILQEQSLVVKTDQGISLITGCSHPGIDNILEKVVEQFPSDPFYLAVGGFHLVNHQRSELLMICSKFKELKVQNVAPTHCTGQGAQKVFEEIYQENYLTAETGKTFEI